MPSRLGPPLRRAAAQRLFSLSDVAALLGCTQDEAALWLFGSGKHPEAGKLRGYTLRQLADLHPAKARTAAPSSPEDAYRQMGALLGATGTVHQQLFGAHFLWSPLPGGGYTFSAEVAGPLAVLAAKLPPPPFGDKLASLEWLIRRGLGFGEAAETRFIELREELGPNDPVVQRLSYQRGVLRKKRIRTTSTTVR